MTTADQVCQALESTQMQFHDLEKSLPQRALREPSANPAWTNGEILFHMAFAFFLLPVLLPLVRLFGRVPKRWSKLFAGVLNAGTGLFNVINALGPHVGGRILSRRALERMFDRVCRRILTIVNTIPEAEWRRGMYYPWKWDGLFQEYMTLADVCLYPCRHFTVHRADLRTANHESEEPMPQ